MPIYEYACITCGKSIEITRGFNEKEEPVICPGCGYVMARMYNAPGVHFKGSGFYTTDKGKR